MAWAHVEHDQWYDNMAPVAQTLYSLMRGCAGATLGSELQFCATTGAGRRVALSATRVPGTATCIGAKQTVAGVVSAGDGKQISRNLFTFAVSGRNVLWRLNALCRVVFGHISTGI